MSSETPRASIASLQRIAAAAGAILLIIGFATGGLLAMAMTNKVNADVPDVLAAHLNAILGCFWLCALAFTLPLVRFGDVGLKRLVLLTIVPNYGNWLVTTVKAFFKVAGVGLNGEAHNDGVFVALNVLVVIPSFAAAIFWAYGLLRAPAAQPK